MIALIKGGAFDSFAPRYKTMVEYLWMTCDKARRYGVNFSSVADGLMLCAKDYKYI